MFFFPYQKNPYVFKLLYLVRLKVENKMVTSRICSIEFNFAVTNRLISTSVKNTSILVKSFVDVIIHHLRLTTKDCTHCKNDVSIISTNISAHPSTICKTIINGQCVDSCIRVSVELKIMI